MRWLSDQFAEKNIISSFINLLTIVFHLAMVSRIKRVEVHSKDIDAPYQKTTHVLYTEFKEPKAPLPR